MNISPMTPICVVRILSNIPLDKSYKDVINFTSLSTQSTYFISKTTKIFNDLTPIKMNNKIRIPVNAQEVYNCNYIMFQNTNFGTKWFYAFIDTIDYINVNMCEIGFTLDAYQTWMFNFTIKPSFVEREHTNDDTIGSNLINENLELGEYTNLSITRADNVFSFKSIVVAATCDYFGNDAVGGEYGGLYSGLFYNSFGDAEQVNSYIELLTSLNKSNAIVSVFTMYDMFATFPGENRKQYTISRNKNYGAINNYVPKNNKLYTFPYNFLYVSNMSGNSAVYNYEYFSSSNCQFIITGDMSCNPQVMLYPLNYKGINQNYDEKLVLDGFPQCSYNIDSFKAWLAQNGSSTVVGGISSAFAAVGGVATGNIPVAVGGALGVASILTKVSSSLTQPPQAHGSSGNSVSWCGDIKEFFFIQKSITREYAIIIDEYFTMYGYATHRLKIPNINGRQSWNYVKTRDIKLVGNIPNDDILVIKNMFDNGVTIWHGDYVGDYNRPNNII